MAHSQLNSPIDLFIQAILHNDEQALRESITQHPEWVLDKLLPKNISRVTHRIASANTPLFLAIEHQATSSAKILVKHTDLTVQNEKGYNAVFYAIVHANFAVIEAMSHQPGFKQALNTPPPNQTLLECLHLEIYLTDPNLAKRQHIANLLFPYVSETISSSDKGNFLHHLCSINPHDDFPYNEPGNLTDLLLLYLQYHPQSARVENSLGLTPLEYAIKNYHFNQEKLMPLFLASDLMHQNKEGNCAMHLIFQCDNPYFYNFLVQTLCDLEPAAALLKNNAGYTPLATAIDHGLYLNEDSIALLLAVSDPFFTTPEGTSLIDLTHNIYRNFDFIDWTREQIRKEQALREKTDLMESAPLKSLDALKKTHRL